MNGSDDVPNTNPANNELTGITVLLIDDSKTIRDTGSDFLMAAGYSVVTAADGFEALAKVVEHRPALVITAIMMHKLDGYQVCALIRNNADFRDIPVVMLSGKERPFEEARARSVGCGSHLPTPFSAESLEAIVEDQLGRARLQSVTGKNQEHSTETSDS